MKETILDILAVALVTILTIVLLYLLYLLLGFIIGFNDQFLAQREMDLYMCKVTGYIWDGVVCIKGFRP